MHTDIPPIAAIRHRPGVVDDCVLLADFVNDCSARGLIVRGLVDEIQGEASKCNPVVRDITTGDLYPIFQDLGPGATGCRIDSAGLAAASIALRRAVETGADLVVANRFGKLEASGEGLAEDMLAVMAAGIPLITLVAEPWLEDWRRFVGDAGDLLAPQRAELEAWRARWFEGERRAFG